MSENLEETNFDYIVLGTGFIESILAGSLARIGKKVLHLDSHQNYGGNWSVFGFRELAQWCINNNNQEHEQILEEGDLGIQYESRYAANFRRVELNLFPTQKETEEPYKISDNDKAFFDYFQLQASEQHFLADLLKTSRSYNLDTTPKLIGSRDSLVETLIRSGVGRYLEFKSVDDIYILDGDRLEKVPSSKEDVFTNKSVSLIEKRKLMKFLTFAMDYEETNLILEGTQDMTYTTFLAEKFKITGKLQDAIVYAIALVDDKASIKEGLDNTHTFVRAMGRFGKGAYLCPLYGGASEIAQAFCRVCAVYGGIYILNQPLDKYVVDKETNTVTGVVTKEGQTYSCGKLISGIDYLNATWMPKEQDFGSWLSRSIVVTDAPLTCNETETFAADGLSYSVFPPSNQQDQPIYAIHQSQESMACPKHQYVTYLWTSSTRENVIKSTIESLLQKSSEEKPIKCIFTCYFDQYLRNVTHQDWHLPTNVIPCNDPDTSLNFESAFKEASDIFHQCEPETEFMPAAEQEPEDDY